MEVKRPTTTHKVGNINGSHRRKFRNGKRSKNINANTRFTVIEKPPIFIKENILSASPNGIIKIDALESTLNCIFQATMMLATFDD